MYPLHYHLRPIFVPYMYPLCMLHEIQIFPKKAKKSQKKAKIGQKGQIFQKSQKKKPKLAKIGFFLANLAFLANFGFLEIFGFLENFGFFGTSCCLSFRRLHKDYLDREYMTQSR
jgi:hypothetical protein